MCEPVTLAGVSMTAAQSMFAASLGISALSAASGYVGQSQTAAAQAEYQSEMAAQRNEQIVANSQAANAAFVEKAAAEGEAQRQRQVATGRETQELTRERVRTAGTATAKSEAAGLSFEMLLADFMREDARYRDTLTQQLEFDAEQSRRTIAGFEAEAADRGSSIQGYTPTPVSSPSILSAGLQVAGAGVDAFKRYSAKDPDTKRYRLA